MDDHEFDDEPEDAPIVRDILSAEHVQLLEELRQEGVEVSLPIDKRTSILSLS